MSKDFFEQVLQQAVLRLKFSPGDQTNECKELCCTLLFRYTPTVIQQQQDKDTLRVWNTETKQIDTIYWKNITEFTEVTEIE